MRPVRGICKTTFSGRAAVTCAAVLAAATVMACDATTPPTGVEPTPVATNATSPTPRTASNPVDLARTLAATDPQIRDLLATGQHPAFSQDRDAFVSSSWNDTGIDRFRRATARLPATSIEPFVIGLGRIGRFGLEVTLEHAAQVSAVELDGAVVYERAFPSTDIVWTSSDDRVEELLVLRGPEAPRAFAWKVGLPPGLRSVSREQSGALAFVDSRGDGVLRVPPAYALDARGTRRSAELEWNDDRLAVSLDTSGLEYPILLDPAVEVVLWEPKTPKTTTPGPRMGHAMAYDDVRGQVVLYGGGDANGSIGDTWSWDGDDWILVDSTTSPARSAIAIAYDSAANVSIMFGACSAETWELSGSTWSKRTPVDAPTSRRYSALSYDPSAGSNGKVFLFAGYKCTLPEQIVDDTWEWDGTNWKELFPSPKPAARMGHAMVYDGKRDQTVLFGGFGAGNYCSGANEAFLGDTWTWNGTAWQNKNPTKAPSGRNGHAMAYDTATGRTVLFGGNNCPFLGDTWEWDGSTWKETTPATSPSVRDSVAMAYDSARGRVVLFGGQTANGLDNHTWEYHSHGAACANDTECDTHHCVDGVCCEQSSCGQCQACNTAAKPGECAPVSNAQDDTCAGTKACNAASSCVEAKGIPCTTTCSSPFFCVDGFCCDKACNGQCEACNGASPGTCAPVTGAPHGTIRSPCTGVGTGCGGVCDGNNTQSCAYPDTTTACRAPSCTASVVTLQEFCDGAGNCPPVQTVSCAPYTCISGGILCNDTCAADAECASSGYCNAATTECKAKSKLGETCTEDRTCETGHCADGVCCDQGCSGQCESCNSGGIKGVCHAVAGDPVGRNACIGKGTPCGGTCDGTNRATCTYPTILCRDASCSADVETFAAFCDGAGICPAVATRGCSAFHCNAAGSACETQCDTVRLCAGGYYCDTGLCTAQLDPSAACTLDGQCKSGHCADGVCCDTACQGQCEACNVLAGSCIPVTGPPPNGKPACGGAGTKCEGSCDGTNRTVCGYPGSTIECRAPSCASDVAVLHAGCDGNGACPALQTQACGAYVCGPTQCLGDCPNGDIDCRAGKYCSAGVCVDKGALGDTCGGDNQCASAHCADDVCCNADCQGQCEACNEANTEGTCTVVSGTPRGSRSTCGGTGVCKATCDGQTAASCTYPDATVVCAPGTCSSGVETTASVCNGSGTCTAATTGPCDGYGCGTTGCKTSCAGLFDCAPGYVCVSGACEAVPDGGTGNAGATGSGGTAGTAGAAGSGASIGVAGSGARGGTTGSGGRGNAGTIGAAPDAGAPDGGGPEPALSLPKDEGGCGCATPGRDKPLHAAPAASLLALAWILSRRRRSTAHRSATTTTDTESTQGVSS